MNGDSESAAARPEPATWCWGMSVEGGLGLGAEFTEAETPLDILKERFAKGEIDKKEYEERRKALEE